MARKSKVISTREAVERFLGDGCRELAVGGMHMHNNPMALIRETVRQGRRVQRLVTSPSADLNADLLIGAGLVEEVLTGYVGFEHLGLAANFRRAVEGGRVRLLEGDEPLIVYGLHAGAGGLPFIPCPRGLELAENRRVNPEYYRETTDPYSGRTVMTVPAIVPEVAFIHCQEADQFGNCVFRGAEFTDRQMAFAAEHVVVQVERLVDTGELQADPKRVGIPGFMVDAVVVEPFGCHPTSSHAYYDYDEAHLKEYLKACKDEQGFRAYLERYVHGVPDEAGYRAALGEERLAGLAKGGVSK